MNATKMNHTLHFVSPAFLLIVPVCHILKANVWKGNPWALGMAPHRLCRVYKFYKNAAIRSRHLSTNGNIGKYWNGEQVEKKIQGENALDRAMT